MTKQNESIHRHLISELCEGTDFPSLLAHYFLAREVPPAILGAVTDIAMRLQAERAVPSSAHRADVELRNTPLALVA